LHWAIDCDDVIVNTNPSLHEYARTLYPEAREDQMPVDRYASTWSIFSNQQEFYDFIERWRKSDYFMNIKPIAASDECLRFLKYYGDTMGVLSGSGSDPSSRERRVEFLEHLGIASLFDYIVCIDPWESKADMLEKMGAEAFVDDGVTYIHDSLSVPSMKLPMLFARPMNREYVEAIRSGNYNIETFGPTGSRKIDLGAVAERAKIENNWGQVVQERRTMGSVR